MDNDLAVKNEFFMTIDKLFSASTSVLNDLAPSQILQDFFFKNILSFLYSNLILNIFANLSSEVKTENKLNEQQVDILKKKYAMVEEDAKFASSNFTLDKTIDKTFYERFKSKIEEEYSDVSKIIYEIEKQMKVDDIERQLEKRKQEIKDCGKSKADFNTIIHTTVVERYVLKEKRLPFYPTADRNGDEKLKEFFMNSVKDISQLKFQNLIYDPSKILNDNREYQKGFEKRLYELWREPIDLFEVFINISLNAGQRKKDKLCGGKDIANAKYLALIKIHARALIISNEVITLLKGGYADGAHARWRSLYELAVVSFFLKENEEYVSRRYLDHQIMKRYKDLDDYQQHCTKLGYEPFTDKQIDTMRKEYEELISKHGKKFKYEKGYEWIPNNIICNPNFKKLEKHVDMIHNRPYYNWSSDAIHSGSKGFDYMGLPKNKGILLAGASIYGLADPINLAAISLSQVTSNLLTLERDSEDIMEMNLMGLLVDEIGKKSLKVHKIVEQEGEHSYNWST